MSTCTARRLTGLEQRALAGVGSRWEGGDAVAVMEKRLGKPVTGTTMAASGAAAAGAASDEGEGEMRNLRRG